MKRINYFILLIFLGSCGLCSCVNETYFGESWEANIVTFNIEGQMSNRVEPMVDWRDVGRVDITVPAGFDLDSLKVVSATCSQLAHFASPVDTIRNFSKPVTIYVVAENQSIVKKWVVTVKKQAVENIQLPFSKFNRWYPATEPSGKLIMIGSQQGYWPGNGIETSPWQSSIQGNSFGQSLGITEFSVHPVPQDAMGEYARIKTIFAGTAAVKQETGVAAGGVFTGEFVFNPGLVLGSNKQPRKMMKVGIPFYARPKGVRFDIRYKGGAKMVNGRNEPITWPEQDSCDILFALQNRLKNPDQWIRIATAALRVPQIGTIPTDNDPNNGFVTLTMPFVYGKPTATQLAEKPYQQIGGSQGELFFYKFTFANNKWNPSENPVPEVYAEDPDITSVDNIMVMFSSSTYGDLFYAAVGSTLDVKNIVLIYE